MIPESRPAPRAWSICAQPPLPVWLTGYDLDKFNLACFAASGIAFPPALARAVPKRQAEYFHGRLCAQAALAQLGINGINVETGAAREPLWPPGVIGSITHTRTLAAAVVLPARSYQGVGIDIERFGDAASQDSIEAMVVNARELALLRAHDGKLGAAAMLSLAFSAKESFYKALFGVVQRFFDFSAIEIDMIDCERGQLGFRLTETLCPQWLVGMRGSAQFELLDEQHVMTGVLW